MEVEAALLRSLPVFRQALIDIGLVNDLGNQLGPLADGAGLGSRQLGA